MEQIISRKPVFDAVRIILGRGFTQTEVEMLDRALDRALSADTPPSPGAGRRLGRLSARFESGGRGPGAVSSGRGDPGGVSYGIYQLSSRAGTAAAFVAAEGARWRDDFAGAAAGSDAFTRAWKAIAARDPEDFADAQHAFIERTHYRPAVSAVLRRTGLDLDGRHPAVRDATWSVAVQHGGAAGILAGAVDGADAVLPRENDGFDRCLVEAIYARRTDYVLRLAARSRGGARRTLENVARNRYPAELAAALAMFEDAVEDG
ncbi:MAG: hypothetical protein H6917_16135 [Novosphingobium sp.]|nr:hypothetical protein [Novosphingobium sp.]MCP5403901.1 hypothetical protein [Novosphingobium sp.]